MAGTHLLLDFVVFVAKFRKHNLLITVSSSITNCIIIDYRHIFQYKSEEKEET